MSIFQFFVNETNNEWFQQQHDEHLQQQQHNEFQQQHDEHLQQDNEHQQHTSIVHQQARWTLVATTWKTLTTYFNCLSMS